MAAAWRARLFGMLLSLLPHGTQAEVVESLHEARQPVASAEMPERLRAMREALGEVIVKLTGDSRIATDPAAIPLVERAADFVARYEFEAQATSAYADRSSRAGPLILHVWFDPVRIEHALRSRGIALWPRDRSQVFVWLDTVAGERRFPLLADDAQGIDQRDALIRAAGRRGVPVRLPQIAYAYRLGHLATEAGDALATLRRMARGGALMVGTSILQPDSSWSFSWQLHDLRGSEDAPIARTFQLEGATLDVGMLAGIDAAARVLARRP
jgi:hypothetical protein